MNDEREQLIQTLEDVASRLAWQHQQRLAAMLSRHGLTVAQFLTVVVLERAGSELTISEIGEIIQVPPSSMTSIVDRLQRDGLIQRLPHPTDRRAVLAHITDDGLALLDAISRERHESLVNLLKDLPVEDIKHSLAILQQIATKSETMLN